MNTEGTSSIHRHLKIKVDFRESPSDWPPIPALPATFTGQLRFLSKVKFGDHRLLLLEPQFPHL